MSSPRRVGVPARSPLGPVALLAIAMMRASPAPAACDPSFQPRADLGLLESPAVTEASGLAASRRYPGVLWTHNDSGDLARVFALNERGEHLGIYTIAGASNRDWEDIATGPGPLPGVSYLYIGEIGDNGAAYATKYVYRLPEPYADSAAAPRDTTVSGAERLAFAYPDGRRDAETLMVDPLTRDIYVVSKRETQVRVYRAAYPQPVGPVITLEHVATIPFTLIVSGDISPNGHEIVMKTYDTVLHWCREEGQTVAAALAAAPTVLPYVEEPQGEAVTWGADGRDYFTTSEEASGVEARLYVYRRSAPSSVDVGLGAAADGAAFTSVAPNPSAGATLIRYRLARSGMVTLCIAGVDGRHVRRLAGGWQDSGDHAVPWDGLGDGGEPMRPGIYYCALSTGMQRQSCRVVRLDAAAR